MSLPVRDYQTTRIRGPRRLPAGADRLADAAMGRYHRRNRVFQRWQSLAAAIHLSAQERQALSDSELRHRLHEMQATFRRQAKGHEQQLPEAFALIAEAAHRTLGIRPFSVQLLGAIVIHHGGLAEMATGEGKSLTACFPAIVAAWTGRPCHIVTANDYLASRDADELAPLYRYCHVTTGWIGGQMGPDERRKSYAHDVVYLTSKELLADFLRDRLALGSHWQPDRYQLRKYLTARGRNEDRLVMRGIDTAIIDEADSVLIDEAVTPLIISQPRANPPLTEACRVATAIAAEFVAGEDYRIDQRYLEVTLTAQGREKLAERSGTLPDIWHGRMRREELLLTALEAREFFHRNRQYVVEDGKVVIVDELTGRMMHQRTWRQGLHQMVEAKEGLPLTNPSETSVRLSFQRFFGFFRKLGGMTGTAREAAGEFWQVYGLPVFAVPTNRPDRRTYLPSAYFPDQAGKWQAICDEVCACHASGQPVLIGTRSIAASEHLAALLAARGLPCQLLNAIRHAEEAAIISAAGRHGMVTIATNMAGRGADIRLDQWVAELGGLHVIVSEPHEAGRIDRQLSGRCGRQGDPGSVRRYCSLEDDLLRRHALKPLLQLAGKKLSANRGVSGRWLNAIVALAQMTAQRQACHQRKAVMQADDWITDALSFARSELSDTL